MSRLLRLSCVVVSICMSAAAQAQPVVPAPAVTYAYQLPVGAPAPTADRAGRDRLSAGLPLSRRARTTRGAVIGGVVGGFLGLSAVTFAEAVEGNADFTGRTAAGLIGGAVFGTVFGALLGRGRPRQAHPD